MAGESGDMLVVKGLWKSFGGVIALRGVSFAAKRGSYVVILGPSGCGKTTLLRIIAGLYEPDRGEVWIDGLKVNGLPPHRRGISMMFQNYALFPHMKVIDNVIYGLRVRGVPREKAVEKALEVSRMLGIEGLLDRYPHELSGGQQQRVALARALVVEPKVLLLDEPLSNLDAKIRAKVRVDLRRIQRELGITTLHVTHDQEEAMSVADEIIVMNNGRIEQVGSPEEVYSRPANVFVADFIGSMNFLEGKVASVDGSNRVVVDIGGVYLVSGGTREGLETGEKVLLGFRPEHARILLEPEDSENIIPVKVVDARFMGPRISYILQFNEETILVDDYTGAYAGFRPGVEAYLHVPPQRVLLFKE